MKKTVVLESAWCKGCGICVAFCPQNVLELAGTKVRLRTESDCVFCGQCELRCPDYAIWIEEAESNA